MNWNRAVWVMLLAMLTFVPAGWSQDRRPPRELQNRPLHRLPQLIKRENSKPVFSSRGLRCRQTETPGDEKQ